MNKKYNSEAILDLVKDSFHFAGRTFVTSENIVRYSYDRIRTTIPEICHQQQTQCSNKLFPKQFSSVQFKPIPNSQKSLGIFTLNQKIILISVLCHKVLPVLVN